MYGVTLTDLGLPTVGTRSVAGNPDNAAGLTGRLVSLRLVLGVATALMIGLAALALPRPTEVKLLLGIYAVAVIAQTLLLEWLFFGVEQMGIVSASRVVAHLTYYGLALLFVRGPQSILLVPLAFVAGTLLAVLVLVAVYCRRFGRLRLRFIPEDWLGLLRQAWPVGAAGVFTQIHVNFGLIGLGLLRSDAETGLYSAAFRLVFFLLTLDRVCYTVFFPVVSRVWANVPDRLPVLTGTALRLILAISLPLGAGLILLARPILVAVFGQNYAEATTALRLLALFVPISMLSSIAGYTLIAAGRERRFLRNVLVGTCVSVLAGLAGILLLGVGGAAVAVVAGEAVILVLLAADFLQVVRPTLNRRLAAPVVGTAAVVLVCLLFGRLGLVATILTAVAVYGVLLTVLGGVTLRDLGVVRR